jgi:small subunit ribosomal protein S17
VTDRKLRNTKIGKVVKSSGEKSISVLVERLVRHSIYGKVYKRSKKYLVHDEVNTANVGDKVEIMQSRPISKNKSWRLTKIIK